MEGGCCNLHGISHIIPTDRLARHCYDVPLPPPAQLPAAVLLHDFHHFRYSFESIHRSDVMIIVTFVIYVCSRNVVVKILIVSSGIWRNLDRQELD